MCRVFYIHPRPPHIMGVQVHAVYTLLHPLPLPPFSRSSRLSHASNPAHDLHLQRAKQVGKAVESAYNAVESYFKTLREKRRHAAAMELIGEMSGKYRGKTKPGTKVDRFESRPMPDKRPDGLTRSTLGRLTRLDVPTWSTSLYNPMANTSMLMCAATGFGLCMIHGHTQDGTSPHNSHPV